MSTGRKICLCKIEKKNPAQRTPHRISLFYNSDRWKTTNALRRLTFIYIVIIQTFVEHQRSPSQRFITNVIFHQWKAQRTAIDHISHWWHCFNTNNFITD